MNDEVQYYIDSFHTQEKLRIEDTHFYKIALTLTGNRDKYELALVEANHPFACGWYGPREQDHLYFGWLASGWKYMKELIQHA